MKILFFRPNPRRHVSIESDQYTYTQIAHYQKVKRYFFAVFKQRIVRFSFTLSFVFTILTSWSQADDPCDCPSFTVVGQVGQTLNVSAYGAIPDCAYIRGQLVINQRTNWTNLRILMGTGTEIYVTDTLELNKSFISGCVDMWKGIRTSGYDSSVDADSTTIKGAELALLLNDGTSLTCTYNTFINNYIGIATSRPHEADQEELIILQEGYIKGNVFYTDGVLPDPYTGQYYAPSWPTSPSEIPYNQGYAAIFITGTIGLNFGFSGATEDDRNLVYQMRNGIIARNSSINIAGSDFYDFEGAISPIQGLSPKLDINQVGISLFNTSALIENNLFDNLIIGVKAYENSQRIFNNVFDIATSPSILSSRGIQIELPTGLSIIGNEVTQGYKGISVSGAYTPFLIRGNNLTRNMSIRRNVGIEINGAKLSNIRDGLIWRNVITTEICQQGSIGIGLTDCHKVTVDSNIISYPISLYAGVQNAGISGMKLISCALIKNEVNGSTAYESLIGNSGIILTNSGYNFVFCNEMDNMYRGMWLVAMNDSTRVEVNTFEQATIAFEIAGPAAIGDQIDAGNEWFGDYEGGYGGFISGEDPTITADYSEFFVNEEEVDPCFLRPCPIGPTEVEGEEWFVPSEGDEKSCISIDDPDGPDDDILAGVLVTALDFEVFNAELTWMRKAQILEAILQDPTLLSNPVLETFYDAVINSALGKVIWCEHQLSIRHGSDIELKLESADSITYYSNDLRELDSIIDLHPINEAAMKVLRELKCDTLQYWVSDLLDQLDVEHSVTLDSIDAAVDTLLNLTTNNSLESDLKDIMLISAPRLKGDTLTTTASGNLEYFATLCPWIGGRSLGWGQRMFSLELDSLLSNTPFECGEMNNIGGGEESRKELKLSEFQSSLYPNPASDFICIDLPSGLAEASVYDIQGVLKVKQTSPGKQIKLDVQLLPVGIYFISIQQQGAISTHKVSILR